MTTTEKAAYFFALLACNVAGIIDAENVAASVAAYYAECNADVSAYRASWVDAFFRGASRRARVRTVRVQFSDDWEYARRSVSPIELANIACRAISEGRTELPSHLGVTAA